MKKDEALTAELNVKLFRRISQLAVYREDGAVVITGAAPSYYAKQLAQEEIKSLVNGETIVNRVRVQ